jgi:TP901 family phage tail tape measure protein
MARNLRLQVMLNAVDRVTGPLKRMRQGAGQTGQAMRETRDQLKELQRTQSDLTSYRKANAAMRQNTRAMRDARARNHQYTQALEQQREAHANVKSGLTVARREYDRLAKELLKTKQPSDQLTASLERARVRLHGQQTEFDRSARAMKEYRNRVRHAGEEVKRLTQDHATQADRIRGLKTRLDEAGISTDNLGRSARELRANEERLNTALQEQKRHLSEVAERQRRLTQARDRYQNGMASVASAQGVGMGMFGTGLAQGYAASRLLTPGVAFGESMSGVQALTRLEADDERFLALKQQARELGSSTAFSATQAADAQGFLAMAGFDSDAIQAAMPSMLNLALANNADLARTADISSNILSGFGLDPNEMQRVSDVLTATTTRANVDLSMLGESMKYVAPQARAMNMSLEQSAAMAGLLGNVGIQGSQAGTTLRAMVVRLAAPTGAAAGALDELGVNAKDAQGNLRDIPNILSDVARATETMGNADQAGYLKAIFGEEPGAGMAELIAQQGTEGIEAFVEVLSNSMGEAARVAKTRADNIGGDLKGLRSAWEDVGISITETNKGPLRDLIQGITKVTRSVSAWIEANPELAGTIAKVAAGLIALATVGGAVTMTFASILSPLLFAKFAMTTLGIKVGGLGAALGWIAKTAIPWVAGALKGLLVAMGPIGWGIAAIAGAAYLIYQYWEPIKAFFVGLWQQVKTAFDEGVGGVARLLLNWSPYGLIYNAITSTVERLGITIPEGFSDFGSMIVDGLIGGIRNKFGELRESISNMASSVSNWFKEILGINSPSRVFEGFGANIVEGIIGGISGMVGTLKDHVTGLAGDIAGWMGDTVGNAVDAGRDIANGLGEGISNAAGWTLAKVRELAGGTEDEARERLDTNSPSRVFRSIGMDVSAGLAGGIEGDADSPVKQVRSIASRLRDAATGLMLSAGIASPAMAMEVQPPELPQLPGLYAHIERPELPTLDALQVERPTLPELSAPEIQRPELPQLPGLYAHIERPELPQLPGLYAHIERPELPTLGALQVERPTLPELSAPEIQRPELPQLPGLYAHIERPELPTLDALQVERPTLPELGALTIQRPELPTVQGLTTHIERPELPTLDALGFQWPELPQFDPLRIDTSGIQIDARPPLQSHASAAPSGGLVIHGGINIEVHAAPGMDEQALARLVNEQVQRALQDAERRAAAASRRNFYDND